LVTKRGRNGEHPALGGKGVRDVLTELHGAGTGSDGARVELIGNASAHLCVDQKPVVYGLS